MKTIEIPRYILESNTYKKCSEYITQLIVEDVTSPKDYSISIPKGSKEIKITFAYQVVKTHPAYTQTTSIFVKDLSDKSLIFVWDELDNMLTNLSNNATKLKNKVS